MKIPLQFIPEGPTEIKSAFRVLVCYLKGHKPSPNLVMTYSYDNMWGHWVKGFVCHCIYLVNIQIRYISVVFFSQLALINVSLP